MRYHALACDYDGTLAHHGKVDESTLAALERFLTTGRRLVMVTGRELDELLSIFPEVGLFEWVVAENGALLYCPATREERALAPRPADLFVERLRDRGVGPISVGRVIVATWQPHEATVIAVIRDMGLELQVIFNKGAVMVLPAGVNKATGLLAALKVMGLSPHEVVGVGDAENDHAFLSQSECAVAVANALIALKDHADMVTRADHGGGVAQLIDDMIHNDLEELDQRMTRHHLVLGTGPDKEEVRLSPYGPNILIAGPSGSGKSTAATSFLERLTEKRYQFCIIDPEGDYDALEALVTLGNRHGGPGVSEVLQVLAKPSQNVVVNLVGLAIADRPPFFLELFVRLHELRTRTGRPHWLIVDEAHHLLPSTWEPGALALSQDLNRTMFITVHPEQIAASALKTVGTVIAVGSAPAATLGQFCDVVGEKPPTVGLRELQAGEVMFWPRRQRASPMPIHVTPSKLERRRHTRKYAEGELPPDRSFYFRGPEGKLNLRAQNLMLFMQLADGVDDATWSYHLHQGDYSRWFRERIKDETLAAEAEVIEADDHASAAESRARVRELIEKRYTAPAASAMLIPGTDAAPVRG